jgi:hypothetical protein
MKDVKHEGSEKGLNVSKVERGTKPLNFTSIGEFLALHHKETEWILDQVLPAGGLSVWAGKPKAGKSTLARMLIVAASKGVPFLGIPTKKSKVLYLALEELESELQKHLRELGATGTDEIQIFCGRAPKDTIEKLFEIAKIHKPDLIVIDPILRAARVKDSNDYSLVTEMFDGLKDLARETGAHVLCVHHAGKGERTGADAVLGSTAFHGAGDATVVIGRTSNQVRIESYQRYGAGISATTLVFDPKTRSFTAGASVADYESQKAGQAIYELIATSSEPLTQVDIYETAGMRKKEAINALSALLKTKQVRRTGAGGKSDPYKYEIEVPHYTVGPQKNGNGV